MAEFFACTDPRCALKRASIKHAHSAGYIPVAAPSPQTSLMAWHYYVPNRHGRWTADAFAQSILEHLARDGFAVTQATPTATTAPSPSQDNTNHGRSMDRQ